MKRHLLLFPLALLLTLGVTFSLSSCAARGTVSHKATVGQHSIQVAVKGFQDAEIAEFNKGFVSADYHALIQQGIVKVAMAGVDLDNYLSANLSTPLDGSVLKQKIDNIYNLLDSISSDGLVGVKNPTSKAALEALLDGIKAIVDGATISK